MYKYARRFAIYCLFMGNSKESKKAFCYKRCLNTDFDNHTVSHKHLLSGKYRNFNRRIAVVLTAGGEELALPETV